MSLGQNRLRDYRVCKGIWSMLSGVVEKDTCKQHQDLLLRLHSKAGVWGPAMASTAFTRVFTQTNLNFVRLI